MNTRGLKLACSASKILLLQRRFFSLSFTAKHCLRLLDWYREALGSNTLTSKNAFLPMIQKLLALTSNLASSFVFTVDGTRSLPVTGCRIGLMATSRQTSSNNTPVMSLNYYDKGSQNLPSYKKLHVEYQFFCHKDTVLVNLVQEADILVTLHPGIAVCLGCN